MFVSVLLVQTRRFHDIYYFEIAALMKLQMLNYTFKNKTKVVVDEIPHLRHLMINYNIQILQEDNNLDF